jgi:hypothetical protein
MAKAKPLHLRLFLEGEEIPVIAASVNFGVGSLATASIQILPLDEAFDIRPRTMVHLFFLDTTSIKDPTQKKVVSLEGNYRLLFCGEAIGIGASQTPHSRAIILQCADFSSYWDAAHAVGVTYQGQDANVFTHTGSMLGANASLFDDIISDMGHRLVWTVGQQPKTPGLQSVSGLAGGIIRLMEVMGGIPNHFKGVNDFFSTAALRCRLLEQVAAEENDRTAYRLLSSKVFIGWLLHGIQQLGERITLREVIDFLFQYIYYDAVPNPVAMFIDSQGASTSRQRDRVIEFSRSSTGSLINTRLERMLSNMRMVLESGKVASDSAFTSLLNNLSNDCNDVVTALQRAYRSNSSSTELRDANEAAVSAQSALETAKVNTTSFRFFPSIQIFQVNIIRVQNILKNFKQNIRDTGRTLSRGAETQRLRSTVIRPDCWFASPPTCNVIFPEQFFNFNYERTWISETTRALIWVHNALIGQDRLLARQVMSPYMDLRDLNKLPPEAKRLRYRTLMDHELHTGIVPQIEWLPEHTFVQNDPDGSKRRVNWARAVASFHFFKFRFAGRQASVMGRFMPNLVCGFPAAIIRKPFMLKDSNALRDVTAGSNQGEMDLILSSAQELGAPRQFIGMVAAIAHSISQEGGSTSVSMHHVRQHMGMDDDFLDLATSTKGSVKRRIIRAVLDLDGALYRQDRRELELIIGCTPQEAEEPEARPTRKSLDELECVVSVESFNPETGKYEPSDVRIKRDSVIEIMNESSRCSRTQTATITHGTFEREYALVPKGRTKLNKGDKGWLGKIVAVEVLDPELQIVEGGRSAFSMVALYEELKLPTATQQPVEDIIQPVWFSNSYRNKNIGKKIYGPLFGCGSVTDEIAVGGVTGSDEEDLHYVSQEDDSILDIGIGLSAKELVKRITKMENEKNRVSVEKAITYISYIYGLVKAQGLDVEEFITEYTKRPIATLEEMLGDPDLDFDVSGRSVKVRPVNRGDGQITYPRIGFHSTAVHPTLVELGGLVGLVEDPTLNVPRINVQKDNEPLAARLDVRKEKRDRVMKYKSALEPGPGAFRG